MLAEPIRSLNYSHARSHAHDIIMPKLVPHTMVLDVKVDEALSTAGAQLGYDLRTSYCGFRES